MESHVRWDYALWSWIECLVVDWFENESEVGKTSYNAVREI